MARLIGRPINFLFSGSPRVNLRIAGKLERRKTMPIENRNTNWHEDVELPKWNQPRMSRLFQIDFIIALSVRQPSPSFSCPFFSVLAAPKNKIAAVRFSSRHRPARIGSPRCRPICRFLYAFLEPTIPLFPCLSVDNAVFLCESAFVVKHHVRLWRNFQVPVLLFGKTFQVEWGLVFQDVLRDVVFPLISFFSCSSSFTSSDS